MKKSSANIMFFVGVVLAVCTAVVPFRVVPPFAETFMSFGDELPLYSHLVVYYYPAVILIPASVVGLYFMPGKIERRAVAALAAGVVSLALVVPAIMMAVYLPVFSAAK